jgi:cardiolipin synthase
VKALILFACLGLTDALDGFLARILNQQTVLGSYLDPIADKVLVTTCFLSLAILKVIPGWLAVVVISKDVLILLGIAVLSIMNVTFRVQPLFVSKVTTALQIAVVFFALFFKAFPLLAIDSVWFLLLYWSTAAFTILAGYQYVVKGVRLINST